MDELLTEKEIKGILDKVYVLATKNKDALRARIFTRESCKSIAKAQLKKARPIIEKQERERIIKIVENEEELDGDMPEDLWQECNTKAGATIVFRAVVRSTKKNILKKVQSLKEGG